MPRRPAATAPGLPAEPDGVPHGPRATDARAAPGRRAQPAQGRSWGDRRALSPGPLLPICCLPATLCSVHLRAKEKGENISAPPTVLCLDEAACRPEPGALAAAPPPHAGPWFPLAGRHPARGVREGTCVCAPARRSPHRRCSRHVIETTCA